MLLVMDRTALRNFVTKYGSLIIFLTLEILLFTSLNLANYGMIYRYIAFLLALALTPIPLLVNQKADWMTFLSLAIPLFIFALFTILSPLYRLLEGTFGNLSVILGLLSFFTMGYALSRSKEFKIAHALLAIFGGLALLLGISLAITMYRYAPFYVLTYAGKVIYYDGEIYVISEEAKWLYAFTVKEVTLAHFGYYSVLVSSLLGAFFFIKPQKPTKKTIVWPIVAGIGALSLILLPNVSAIKFLLIPLAVMAILRYYPRKPLALKVGKYVLYGLSGLAGVAVILFAARSFGGQAVADFFRQIPPLRYLFENSRVYAFTYVTGQAFAYPFGGLYDIYASSSSIVESTGSFIFDTLYQGGIFAAVGLMVFVALSALSVIRYYKKSSDAPFIKAAIVSFLLAFTVYAAFDYPYVQMVHELDQVYKSPFASDMPLLLALFLLGYTVTSPGRSTSEKI